MGTYFGPHESSVLEVRLNASSLKLQLWWEISLVFKETHCAKRKEEDEVIPRVVVCIEKGEKGSAIKALGLFEKQERGVAAEAMSPSEFVCILGVLKPARSSSQAFLVGSDGPGLLGLASLVGFDGSRSRSVGLDCSKPKEAWLGESASSSALSNRPVKNKGHVGP